MNDYEVRLRNLVKRVKGVAALGCDGSSAEMDNESMQQVMQVLLESACEMDEILEKTTLTAKQG